MRKIILSVSILLSCTSLLKAQESSATKVFEYRPAPGQFINLLPAYANGDNEQTICNKCLEAFKTTQLVSFGGFGGYIVLGFDHSIINVPGEYDFKIDANAMDGPYGISSEPGIVLVSVDSNRNGLPDDEWYELKGSEYNNPQSIKNYTVTYTKPDRNDEDIKWIDNKGESGVIQYMGSQGHKQAHYPLWISERTLTFTGTRLPDNAVKISSNPEKWKQVAYAYGYADNKPNNTDGAKFKIDWAVNEKGETVSLDKIDFIKIYTAVNQQCGWLGELSTEILSIDDLHPTATSIHSYDLNSEIDYRDGNLTVTSKRECTLEIYNLQGILLKSERIGQGKSTLPLLLPKGIYLIRTEETSRKLTIN